MSVVIRNEPVSAVMTRDVHAVDVDDDLSAVRELLRRHCFHHVPVTRDGVLVGIISFTDLAALDLEAWGVDSDTMDTTLDHAFTVFDVMTHDVESLRDDDSVYRATEVLAEGRFHALPVVDDQNRLVGVVSSTDLLRYLYRAF